MNRAPAARALLLGMSASALLFGMSACAPLSLGTSEPEPTVGVPAVGVPADAVPMTVVAITDGDTLRLRTDEPGVLVTTTDPIAVRLIGIDTPEVHPEAECFGAEATAALEALAPVGAELRVAPDIDKWDRHDRRLFYLWNADGEFVNLRLVADGMAVAIRVEPNTAHFDELRAAEQAARQAGLGMWGACARG